MTIPDPHDSPYAGLLEFLRSAERLKRTHRSAFTSLGERESVAEHSWRLCLMAMVFHPSFPEADLSRLLRICLVHDLGEAIGGDIPAPMQEGAASKAGQERADLESIIAPLPLAQRADFLALWDEYEAAQSVEAKLAKALDKLETIMQHNQGENPPDFDYRFNLSYGRRHTDAVPLLAEVRRELDADTERRARTRDLEDHTDGDADKNAERDAQGGLASA